MKNIITFSGGKDSLATIIWAKNNLPDFEVVFCDTGWESEQTYQHIKQIEEWIGKKFTFLTNKKYPAGFIDLCIINKRIPSRYVRFCTVELKVEPMIDYILSLNSDVTIVQGVRAEESVSRANMKENEEYFKFYVEPKKYNKKGKPVYDTYRKKDVIKYIDSYSVDVIRPIHKWSAQQVFEYIFDAGLKANPLYYQGFSRVGCLPCIMARHLEIKLIVEKFPDRIEKIRELEKKLNSSFFPSGYIPEKYCTGRIVKSNGKATSFPWIDDVINYVRTDPNQTELFPKNIGCQSVYSICESGN